MGRWWEEKTLVPEAELVSWIRIEPDRKEGLRVRLQYANGATRDFLELPESFENAQIHVGTLRLGETLRRLDADIWMVDEWGDCGPPCKYADVFAVTVRERARRYP